MATLSLAAISAVMNLVYADSMADLIRRDVLLPNILPVRTDGNNVATWPVKSNARTAGGAYAEGADMVDDDYDAHARTQASLAWAQYRAGAKVSGLSEALARANGSPALNPGVFEDEIRDAIDKVAVDLSTHAYSGNVAASPTQLAGLAAAIDSSGNYAGVNIGTYTDWVSAENTLAAADLSFETLRENLHRPVKDACGMWPRVVVCDGATFDRVGALFGDQRRYVDEIVNVGGQMVNLKLRGGYRAIEVDGIPYVEDRHATANTLYAIGPDAIEWRQVPAQGPDQAGVVVAAMKALTGTELDLDEVRRMLAARANRLQPTVEMLGRTGDAHKAMIKVYCQLIVRYRNRCGKLLLT
jgi:hypothetical protein